MDKLYALFGIFIICLLSWITGGMKEINVKQTTKAFFALAVIGLLLFKLPQTKLIFDLFNDAFVIFIKGASEGNKFVFGHLADDKNGFILAFQALTLVIFFSSISAIMYKLKIIPVLVNFLSKIFKKLMDLSGVEALASASGIFVGIEVVLFLRSYLTDLPRSKMFLLITSMMATVASTVMGIYVFFLKDAFPSIAGHLLGASILSIPATVLVCKLIMPDDKNEVYRDGNVKMQDIYKDMSLMESFLAGTQDGVKMAVGITSTLIAVIGLKGALDVILVSSFDLNLMSILKFGFQPFSYLIGINPEGRDIAAVILSTRFTDTEVSAYLKLAQTISATPNLLDSSSKAALVYTLCGFSHIHLSESSPEASPPSCPKEEKK